MCDWFELDEELESIWTCWWPNPLEIVEGEGERKWKVCGGINVTKGLDGVEWVVDWTCDVESEGAISFTTSLKLDEMLFSVFSYSSSSLWSMTTLC